MSERQCREALLRLPAGREGGDAGASRQASRTVCHSDTCGSGDPRFATSRQRRQLPSLLHRRLRLRCCCCYRRGETGGSSCIDAASAVPAQPAAVKPAARAPPAKSAAKPPASAPPPAAAPPAVIVVAPRQIFALVRTNCRAEYRAYCSDVDIGGGRVVACLQANAASLSPTCQSGLAELGR